MSESAVSHPLVPRLSGEDLCSACGKPELVESTYRSQNRDHAGVTCSCEHPYFWRHYVAEYWSHWVPAGEEKAG